jgi:AcrR family transcriptional regulator
MARPRTDIAPRIVRAARARFLAEGVDGASLRTIAADAGTNIGMVFYYFPTKDDLFLAVVEEFYARLLDDLGLALSGDASVRERVRRVFVRLGGASDGEIEIMRLVAREALLSSTRFKRIAARAQRGHIAMLLETLAGGVRGGEIDPDLPLPLVLICTFSMGAIPQVVRRAIGNRAAFSALPPPQALAEMSASLLFRAIGVPKKTRKAPAKTPKARRPAPKRLTDSRRR